MDDDDPAASVREKENVSKQVGQMTIHSGPSFAGTQQATPAATRQLTPAATQQATPLSPKSFSSDEAPNTAVADEKPLSKEGNSLVTKVLRAKLVESIREVEVQHKDPNSPLYSVRPFEEL